MKRRAIGFVFCWVMAGMVMMASAQDDATVPVAEESSGMSAIETGKGVAQGVGSAVSEVGSAVKTGSGSVVDQSREMWQEAILPMLQRTATAIPVIIKAVVLLVLFWLVARIVGAAVRKLLGLTQIDNKAVKAWGLDGLLTRSDGSKISIENLAGGLVKWVILLFGFVAFFNALNLEMVAGPLQGIIDKIAEAFPSILKAIVILLGYWILASIVRLALGKGLGALKFDDRAGKYFPGKEEDGKKVGPTDQVAKLFFYVILLFGLAPFLEALGQQALVEPLQDMLSKTLGFIPNILMAVILIIIGNVVAVVVREVVAGLLKTIGADDFAGRLGISNIFGKQKLSGVVSTIIYVIVLVPIVIAALDALQISAISDPLKSMLEGIVVVIPKIILSIVILFIGYTVAKFVKGIVENLLSGLGVNSMPERLGLSFLTPKSDKQSLSAVISGVVMVIILLLIAQQALAILGLQQLADLADRFVQYLPNLFVGIIILLAAMSLGRYVGGLVVEAAGSSPSANTLGLVARYAIIFLGAGMALDELGVSEQIVTVAVTAVLGGAALAIGLAFGLGGQSRAKSVIEKNNNYLGRG